MKIVELAKVDNVHIILPLWVSNNSNIKPKNSPRLTELEDL